MILEFPVTRSFPLRDDPSAVSNDPLRPFAGGVAHVFNNLLSVIQGNAELALANLEPQKVGHLRGILRATERGAELLSWILSYSQNQMLNPSPTDLRVFVDQSATLWARIVPETIEVIVEHGLESPVVEVDRTQLRTAFLNLIVNARDSIDEEGEITITTGTERIDDSVRAAALNVPIGNYGFLSVSDTGRGINRADLAHVCAPFFSSKKSGEGVGLGLSMVRGFMAQSGGGLEIVSEPGLGTTVRLFFALTQARAAEPGPAAESEELPLGNGESILVVEDDHDLRALLVVMLEGLNYHVTAFESADEALERGDVIKMAALILSDIHLPGGQNGLQMAKESAKLNPNLKVVLMSANPRHVDYDGIRPPGVDEFVLKPFTHKTLARVVHTVLSQAR